MSEQLKPYFQDDAVTIYHLTNVPMCDNLSLEYCTEVYLWMPKKEHEDIGQDNVVRLYQSYHLVQKRVINKLRNILRNASDLAQNIIIGKVTILLLPVVVVEQSASSPVNHAKYAVKATQKDTIRMGIQATMNQLMSCSFAVNAI